MTFEYIKDIKKEKKQKVKDYIEEYWKHDINNFFWDVRFIPSVDESWEDKSCDSVYFEISRFDSKSGRTELLKFPINNFVIGTVDVPSLTED